VPWYALNALFSIILQWLSLNKFAHFTLKDAWNEILSYFQLEKEVKMLSNKLNAKKLRIRKRIDEARKWSEKNEKEA